jgi:RNA polymerase sigma factor (sigma-70 family)
LSQASLETLSDEDIIAGCRSGKSFAWQAFIDRFSGLVHWSVWKYVDILPGPEREDFVREIFQDFFIKLVEKRLLDDLKEAAKIRKFIVVSVTHLAQDRLKQQNRIHARHKPLDGIFDLANPSSGADERLDTLTSAVEELSPKEKTLLDFCYGEDMTHGDIAILLGMEQEAVSTVIRRSKEKIKKKMADRGF